MNYFKPISPAIVILLSLIFSPALSWSAQSNSVCATPLVTQQPLHGLDVVFLNPGESSDKGTGDFWLNVSSAMQAAAKDFGMHLEIFYAERDHLLVQQQADKIFSRSIPPDFLVIVNEKMTAEPIIKKANAKGIRTLLILNTLSESQQMTMGAPRAKYPCWIGELIPDNRKAGYLLAQQLTQQTYKQNPQAKTINMLALMGDYVTQASIDREKGLQDFLAEDLRVQLKHRYVGLWKKQRAEQMVMAAMQQNSDIDVIWSANDAMAMGALLAVKQQSQKILVGGINWDANAVQKLVSQDLAVDVGGHFMIGGWAMVLLNDYANGHDFASESLSFRPIGFSVLTSNSSVNNFSDFPKKQIHDINFLNLSKQGQHNQIYRFDVNQLFFNKNNFSRK